MECLTGVERRPGDRPQSWGIDSEDPAISEGKDGLGKILTKFARLRKILGKGVLLVESSKLPHDVASLPYPILSPSPTSTLGIRESEF